MTHNGQAATRPINQPITKQKTSCSLATDRCICLGRDASLTVPKVFIEVGIRSQNMSKIVKCHCKEPCKILSGAGGKEFVKCERKEKNSCNYFMTVKEGEELATKRRQVKKNFSSFADFPYCRHHLKAKSRVASIKAKDPGRPFFCCNVKAPDDRCEFFHWADEPYQGEDNAITT